MILFFFETIGPFFFLEGEVFDFLRLVAMKENNPLRYKFTLPDKERDFLSENFWDVDNTSHNYGNKGNGHYRSCRNILEQSNFFIKFWLNNICQFFNSCVKTLNAHNHAYTDAL